MTKHLIIGWLTTKGRWIALSRPSADVEWVGLFENNRLESMLGDAFEKFVRDNPTADVSVSSRSVALLQDDVCERPEDLPGTALNSSLCIYLPEGGASADKWATIVRATSGDVFSQGRGGRLRYSQLVEVVREYFKSQGWQSFQPWSSGESGVRRPGHDRSVLIRPSWTAATILPEYHAVSPAPTPEPAKVDPTALRKAKARLADRKARGAVEEAGGTQ